VPLKIVYFASQDGSIATVAMTYMYMHTLYTKLFTRLHVNFAPKAYIYAKLSIACSTVLQAFSNSATLFTITTHRSPCEC